MQPRMNAIQKSTTISKKTTQKVKGRTQFPRKNEQLRLRSMEVKLKGAETKLEPILVYVMKDFCPWNLRELKILREYSDVLADLNARFKGFYFWHALSFRYLKKERF